MRFDFFSPQVRDNPFSSLIMLVLGVIILSLQDSLIKLMSSETSFWQLQFIRSIGNIFLLFLIAKFTNSIHLLIPLNWKPVYFRALMMTTCMFCFFAASPKLSFAQMAAGLYTFPIFVIGNPSSHSFLNLFNLSSSQTKFFSIICPLLPKL